MKRSRDKWLASRVGKDTLRVTKSHRADVYRPRERPEREEGLCNRVDKVYRRRETYKREERSSSTPTEEPEEGEIIESGSSSIKSRSTSVEELWEKEVRDRRSSSSSLSATRPHLVAGQFSNTPWVEEMTTHMWSTYRRITVDDMDMIKAGQYIYYLQSFTVAPECHTESGRVPEFGTARTQQKGRFALVLGKSAQHIKVVPCYTFHGRGFEDAKPRRAWHEYISLEGTVIPCPLSLLSWLRHLCAKSTGRMLPFH